MLTLYVRYFKIIIDQIFSFHIRTFRKFQRTKIIFRPLFLTKVNQVCKIMKLTPRQLVLSLPTLFLLSKDFSFHALSFTQVPQMNPFRVQRAWRASTSILSRNKNMGKRNCKESEETSLYLNNATSCVYQDL